MKVFINLNKGFQTSSKVLKMVIMLWLINFFVSLILGLPMFGILKTSLGSSTAGERMANGFDYLWWQEFKDESQGLAQTFRPSIINQGALLDNLEYLLEMRFFQLPLAVLVLILIYIIVHTFLAGGILSIFNQDEIKFTIKKFFWGAGQYFLRFLLLMIMSWLFFLAIGLFLNSGFNSIINKITANFLTEVQPFYAGLIFKAVILFLLLFIQMVFDYTRIKIIVEDSKNILKSALKAFGFVFRHLGSTFGLYYILFFVSIIIAVLYVVLKSLIPQSNFGTVVVAFLIQQAFIWAIIWLRCWLYSSQLELNRYLK